MFTPILAASLLGGSLLGAGQGLSGDMMMHGGVGSFGHDPLSVFDDRTFGTFSDVKMAAEQKLQSAEMKIVKVRTHLASMRHMLDAGTILTVEAQLTAAENALAAGKVHFASGMYDSALVAAKQAKELVRDAMTTLHSSMGMGGVHGFGTFGVDGFDNSGPGSGAFGFGNVVSPVSTLGVFDDNDDRFEVRRRVDLRNDNDNAFGNPFLFGDNDNRVRVEERFRVDNDNRLGNPFLFGGVGSNNADRRFETRVRVDNDNDGVNDVFDFDDDRLDRRFDVRVRNDNDLDNVFDLDGGGNSGRH